VPIMISSLVVVFAVVELIILPFLSEAFLYHEPMVAGAWMGLAVKTDGAAVASGAIVDALIRGKALADGINYQPDWIMGTAATVKVFIDVFIGVWAFILAFIWCSIIDCKPGEKMTIRPGQIWERFPKFVIGYVITFVLIMFICFPVAKNITALGSQLAGLNKQVAASEAKLATTKDKQEVSTINGQITAIKGQIADVNNQLKAQNITMNAAKNGTGEANVFRGLFFVMTFFTIGVVSNFRKLWEEGIGKLAAVYFISLFGFVIWIGLIISWIFFHGVKPPLVG